jgi:hypothetical protein
MDHLIAAAASVRKHLIVSAQSLRELQASEIHHLARFLGSCLRFLLCY